MMKNGSQLGWLALPVALATLAFGSVAEDQPNPPQWPETVRVFSPGDTDIEDVVNAAYAINGGHTPADHGQFSSARYAFLFKPGNYSATVPVGYYTTIAGLGTSPLDVVFNGKMGVFCPEGDYDMTGGALDTFWRSAENFRMSTSFEWMGNAGMLWAVSQAAPLRRVVVDGDLSLYEYEPPFGGAGYSSGGFLANSNVTGSIYAGSQQQWFSRNSHLGWWKGGVWNMVFVGCDGDVYQSGCEAVWTPGPAPGAVTNVALTTVVAEKPFIIVDTANPTKFSLAIPNPRFNSTGSDWDVGRTVPFEQVYVASNATDTSVVVIMGHEGCGAVKAAQLSEDQIRQEPTNLSAMLSQMKKGLDDHRLQAIHDARARDRESVVTNVRKQLEMLSSNDTIMEKVRSGQMLVVGAFYEISSGIVDFFDEISAEQIEQMAVDAANGEAVLAATQGQTKYVGARAGRSSSAPSPARPNRSTTAP
eukprot:gene64-18190_t